MASRDKILSHQFIFAIVFTFTLIGLWIVTLALISHPQVNQYQQELELFRAFSNAALISLLLIVFLNIITNQAFEKEEKVGRILPTHLLKTVKLGSQQASSVSYFLQY